MQRAVGVAGSDVGLLMASVQSEVPSLCGKVWIGLFVNTL
jgi:hypothetical protein